MPVGSLPKPNLAERMFGEILAFTDEALFDQCGVRIAFTGRLGGVSSGSYGSLNLGIHVDDDARAVAENRARLLAAMGAADAPLLVPNQVHGTVVTVVPRSCSADVPETLEAVQAQLAAGCDAVVVEPEDVAACLCFADCLPVILVGSSGMFAVAHAGWRGAVAGIAGLAARELAHAQSLETGETESEVLAGMNAYIGPYIHVECFETGTDVAQRFAETYGSACAPNGCSVNLGVAVSTDLENAGLDPERIADVRVCTRCNPEKFYSYRASGGVCGRHGAFAVRKKG